MIWSSPPIVARQLGSQIGEGIGKPRPSSGDRRAGRLYTLNCGEPGKFPDVPLLQMDESTDVSLTWGIEAPRDQVWECITDVGSLSEWLGNVVDGAVGAGSEFVVDHGGNYCCRSTVVAYAEPSRLTFTWHFPDEPESEVTIELTASADATELRLTHTALGDLASSYRDGWCVHLSYLEGAALGTPLPPSMFWRLHGTIAQLNTR
jgi:uncharacterized protein YndB with AHSA1/START domain